MHWTSILNENIATLNCNYAWCKMLCFIIVIALLEIFIKEGYGIIISKDLSIIIYIAGFFMYFIHLFFLLNSWSHLKEVCMNCTLFDLLCCFSYNCKGITIFSHNFCVSNGRIEWLVFSLRHFYISYIQIQFQHSHKQTTNRIVLKNRLYIICFYSFFSYTVR